MCTVTWFFGLNGYELFCNRDERPSRPEASGPQHIERGPRRALAPIDGLAGGTWLAVNDVGVTLCLLNVYDPLPGSVVPAQPASAANLRSRGLLVLDLMDVANSDQVEARLQGEDLGRYADFQLLALAPQAPARVFTWWGGRLDARMPAGEPPLLVSSAFRVEEVRAARRAWFERCLAGIAGEGPLGAAHERFHASHEPERGAYSPCMHREDAHTVSFTRVRVERRRAELEYRGSSPCRSVAPRRLELDLHL